jgi:hypothetical protein
MGFFISRVLVSGTPAPFRPFCRGLPPHISNGETQALTERRSQAEHQQLFEISSRSVLQRLIAVLWPTDQW